MKVGIIGLGFRLGYLARVFAQCVPEFRIVAVVDPEPAGLATAKAHGIALGRFHDSPQAMLAAESLDLLMIGSPNHLHLDHLRLGLAAGCKIFCEKPVVTTMAETLELAALLATHPPDQVMVGLVLRHAPLFVDLRRAIADGQMGEVVSMEASEHIAPWHGAFFMRDWRRYERYSGSFLLEKCCHDLDLYTAVMGCRPARVASFGGRKSFTPRNAPQGLGANDLSIYHAKPSGWQGSDRVFDSDADIVDFQTAIIEYASGAAMTFHTNMNVPDEFRRFCVIGAQGMAEGDFVRNFLRVHDARTGTRLVDRSYAASALSHHYGADEQMARDIGGHVTRGTPLPVSVIDALEAGLLAMAIDSARRSGTVVDMAPLWRDFDAALGRADGHAA